MKFIMYKRNDDNTIKYEKKFPSPNQETAEFYTLLESRTLQQGESIVLKKDMGSYFANIMTIWR